MSLSRTGHPRGEEIYQSTLILDPGLHSSVNPTCLLSTDILRDRNGPEESQFYRDDV